MKIFLFNYLKNYFFQIILACSLLFSFSYSSFATEYKPKEISVVSDDNYPPYIFRDASGNLQGILVDQWALWSKKTGIKVTIIGMDWGRALKYMKDGKSDVIETVFKTEERTNFFDFSEPYVTIEVPVFFHKTLSGISNIYNLQGFTVGVKSGDACITVLKKNGITSIKEYASYEDIIIAAKKGQIRIFSVDKPPAIYYLYKMNLENDFRYSFSLYSGKFHRAVIKGNTHILTLIESGFSSISNKEYKQINNKWLGKSLINLNIIRNILIAFCILLLVVASLFIFNVILRKRIKQHTLKLAQSEEKYRLLVQNSLEVIFVTQNGIVKFVNPRCAMFTGLPENEIVGKSISEFVIPDVYQKIQIQYQKLINGEITSSHRELEFISHNNKKFWVRINSVRIIWEGEYAILHIGDDLTDHKASEETLKKQNETYLLLNEQYTEINKQLNTTIEEMQGINTELIIAKEKAVESDKLKSAFLANMSHEIRTPMNGIMGFADLLSLPDITSKERNEYVDVINSSCTQLLAIITDIIEISKIETNQAKLSKNTMNLNKLIKNIYSNFIVKVKKENKILLRSNVDFFNKYIIESDEVKLHQIISNLVENAIKFTEYGYVDFGYIITDDNKIQFYVSDTGIGISNENFDLIFNRFRQIDITRKKSKGGTGLGLSICKAYVNLLGGEIWLESEVNKGTTFFFTIPNTVVTSIEEEKEEEEVFLIENLNLKGKKILVAEDDDTNYMYIESVLFKTNVILIRANDGNELISLLNENSDVNLILLDIKMPNKNGIEATIEIRKTNKSIPIIAQTAYSFNEEQQMVLDAGVNGYLAKPIKKADLYTIIAKYIS